jgi:ribonuclease E
MSKKKSTMLLDCLSPGFTRLAVINENATQLEDFDCFTETDYEKGSIHVGIIEKVFPSLQAAFVRFKSSGKNGFLPFSEISPEHLLTKMDCGDFADCADHLDLEETDLAGEEILDIPAQNIENSTGNPGFLCKNQKIIVQVMKEERGTKGAMLSTYIYLEGQYCVFIPNKGDKTGLVQNSLSLSERKRVEMMINNIKLPENSSIIINYNGFFASLGDIKSDLNALVKRWSEIKSKASKVMQNFDFSKSVLRSNSNIAKIIFANSNLNVFENIIINEKESYLSAVNFLKGYSQEHADLVKLYDEKMPIFLKYGVEKLIDAEFGHTVTLKSGGYLVIQVTEALISIDVNSGKNNDSVSVEDTAFKTNIEAVQEAFKQIKLRKLSGLIIIDLIGMKNDENNRAIEGIAKRLSFSDKSKIQISMIYDVSVLIISKQRLDQPIHEMFLSKCSVCEGSGMVYDEKFIVYKLFNELRYNLICIKEKNKSLAADFEIFGSKRLVELLINDYRSGIVALEAELNSRIKVAFSSDVDGLSYKINVTSLNSISVEKLDEDKEISGVLIESPGANQDNQKVKKDNLAISIFGLESSAVFDEWINCL